MADRVLNAHEIVLNSVKFPIDGFVREQLVSRFPQKLTTGDYSYANEQILSNFIISDQRGGMLVEEMDEAIHQDRYFWSTCETRFRSNILLPPLTTAMTLPSGESTAASLVNTDMELDANWTGGLQDNTRTHSGSQAWRVNQNANAYQDAATWVSAWQGATFKFGCWVNTTHVDACRIAINDGVGTTYSSYQASSGNFEWLEVTRTLDGSATRLRCTLDTNNVAGAIGWFDDCAICSPATGTIQHFANFNSEVYASYGQMLIKQNSGATGFDLVDIFPTTITDLVLSSDGKLLIYLGDTFNYWYMDTSENMTMTSIALANKGLRWDGKTWKMAVNGRWFSIVSPGVGTPSWTAADASGGLNDYNVTPKSIDVYRDSNGNLIPYCATTIGLYAFSSDDSKWIETELSLPEHDQTGLGFVVWHDASFVSGGLSVSKYVSATVATISEIGLTKDDGMPQLRSGEIVKFIKGYNEFFALIDSTYEGSGSRSQVVSYDGKGWRTWWEATANNKNMYGGIVTSANAHQLLFSTTDGAYSIPLQRTSLNPKKVSGYKYAAVGTHISPRFDAGTKAFPKLATKLTLFLDDMSANETVAVTYQVDQAQGALTSTWTALMSAQTSDGVKEQTFGTSGVGILFYDIQFRAALVNSTNTNSPIIKGMVLSYLKILDGKKAWNITINTAEAARVGAEPKKLFDSLVTILATNALIPFNFRDGSAASDTHYVLLSPFSGFTPSGPNWKGTFNLTLVEV